MHLIHFLKEMVYSMSRPLSFGGAVLGKRKGNKKQQLKVVYEEATSLWHDYAIALHDMQHEFMTERCMNLSHRIIALGQAFGAVHWKDVPLSIVVTHYESTYVRGNINFPAINWRRVNEVRRAIMDLNVPVVTHSPLTVTDYELLTTAPNPRGDFTAVMDVIQLEGTYDDTLDVRNDHSNTGRHHIA